MNNIIKTVLSFAVAGVIAVAGYFTKAYTVDEAVAVVTDTAKATEACESLLKGQGFKTADPVETGAASGTAVVTTTTVVDDNGEAVKEKETTTPIIPTE